MILFINNKDISYSYLKCNIDFDSITRKFLLKRNSDHQEFEIGDRVVIKHFSDDNDNIFNGIIERISLSEDSEWLYYGQNNLRKLLYKNAEKNIQFPKNQSIRNIFEKLTDFEIISDVMLPKNLNFKIEISDSILDFLNKLSYISSSLFYVNRNEQIVINNDINRDKKIKLDLYNNIPNSNRNIFFDTMDVFDKYTIIANNSSYSIGMGSKEYVENLGFSLTAHDLEKIAKHKQKLNYINAFQYNTQIEYTNQVDLNDLFIIEDPIFPIKDPLRSVQIEYEKGYDIENLKLGLARLYE